MAKKVGHNELGKGIRALLNNIDNQPTERKSQIVKKLSNSIAEIEIEKIRVNPFQPRKEFDDQALKELSNSIKQFGLIQPITVRRLNDDQYQLISGERRFRAAQTAGLTAIPAYIRVANDQEMLEMALLENIQRENLNALEIGLNYQRLIDECKLTHEELATRMSKDRSTITNYIRLLKLPPEIQGAVRDKRISMGHARALTGIDDISLQLVTFNKTIEGGLSVRALESLIRSYKTPTPSSSEQPNNISAEEEKIEDSLSNMFGAKVKYKVNKKGKGSITIPFKNTAALNRILDVLDI